MSAFVEPIAHHEGWSLDRGAARSALAGGSPQSDVIPGERRQALLARFVEAEILPRLAMSAGMAARDASGTAAHEPGADEFVCLLLAEDDGAGMAYVDRLRDGGVPLRTIYLGLLTDSARTLGEMWQDDRCSFVEVTIGVGRLHQILRHLSPEFAAGRVARGDASRILLATAPGEQHTFGLVMLAEFFRSAGWHVGGGPAISDEEAADLVHDRWFDVAGFSIGAELGVDRMARCIRMVRRASCNRAIGVLIGGPLFLSDPGVVVRVGADAGAADANGAIRQARSLLSFQQVSAA